MRRVFGRDRIVRAAQLRHALSPGGNKKMSVKVDLASGQHLEGNFLELSGLASMDKHSVVNGHLSQLPRLEFVFLCLVVLFAH